MSLESVNAALERGRMPHALLFLGTAGSGQLEAARGLASALFCEARKKAVACGRCAQCRLMLAGNHPDFKVFEPEEDSRTLKVEQVRALIAQAALKPFQAACKVFVIDRAEAMNDIAQNALLKTLEEPPAQTYLILISYAAEKMLSTIRSRAQEVRFQEKDAAAQPDPEGEEAERALIEYLLGKPAPDLAGLTREKALRALEGAIRGLRGALRAGLGVSRGEGRPGVAALAERYSADELAERIEKLAEFKEKIAQNVNMKLAFSVLWDEL